MLIPNYEIQFLICVLEIRVEIFSAFLNYLFRIGRRNLKEKNDRIRTMIISFFFCSFLSRSSRFHNNGFGKGQSVRERFLEFKQFKKQCKKLNQN